MRPQHIDLGARNTPLQAADRLGTALGFTPGSLWIKRDDLTGLAAGGNKARKLEYVCADAIQQGADVLVTGGSMAQSNQINAVAAAANRIGMRARVVLPGTPPERLEGNLIVNHLLGVEYKWIARVPEQGMDWAIDEDARQVREQGNLPYVIPLGVSSTIGCFGYVDAAAEIEAHAPPNSVVYHATGTAGTQAGLAVGLGTHERVLGVDTGAPWDIQQRVAELAESTSHAAGLPSPTGRPRVLSDYVGLGYGHPTEAGRKAMYLLAQTEGILAEPTYTGKALAALIHDRRSGRLAPDQPTVFLHTGGLPLLYTADHERWLTSPPSTTGQS